MLRKPEAKFWQLIKRNLIDIAWTRVENRSTAGFPDLLGCHENCGFFTVELKVLKGNKLLLTPQQISWNYKHYHKGGSCFILATPLEQSTIKIYGGGESRELSLNVHKTPTATLNILNYSLFVFFYIFYSRSRSLLMIQVMGLIMIQ